MRSKNYNFLAVMIMREKAPVLAFVIGLLRRVVRGRCLFLNIVINSVPIFACKGRTCLFPDPL
jgi:hypothetical protein